MANVKFDDYLNDELKNNDFKNGYLNEKTILESSLNVASTGLPQRQLTEIIHVSNLQLQEFNVYVIPV